MALPLDASSIDPRLQLLDLDRTDQEESLYEFYKAAWKYIDPSPWADSWAIDAMCEHLQAIVDGYIKQLIINCPPRIGKQIADETPVLTTAGWKAHGDLRPGDDVFHPSGTPTRVVAISGKSPSDIRVEFFDGSVFWCHENHEWALRNKTSHKTEILETNHFLRSRKGRWGQTKGSAKKVLCREGKPYWSVAFQPTLKIPTALPRKEIKRFPELRHIGLKSITRDPCGKIGHCIQVEATDGMYLIGKTLIPTHNSSLCSVAFPAWTWAQPLRTHTSAPGVRFLHASYNDKLSLRDSVKCRRLLESQWYRDRWGDRFRLTSDQNTKSRFTNDQGGERLITSIGAGVTGEGGDIILIDDPQAANETASEANIQEVLDWWSTVMPTRRNSLEKSAVVIIQQRLAENDLTGHVLETECDGWTHLCLPGRHEPDRSFITTIGWKDPRTEPGELLWPERFSEVELKRLETRMGPFVFAGQIQQRPEPAGGGIIKLEWWQPWVRPDFPKMDFKLACLDTAYTEDTANDPSGLIIWGVFSDKTVSPNRVVDREGRLQSTWREDVQLQNVAAPKVMLMWSWDKHLQFHELVQEVAKACIYWNIDLLLIENKASGISVAQEIRRLYNNEKFGVQLFDPKSQDKFSRLYSVQHLFAEGIIYAPEKIWSQRVISQVGSFGGRPGPKHDEYVDLTSMGLRYLRDNGLIARAPERLVELEALKIYPRAQSNQPLYPV